MCKHGNMFSLAVLIGRGLDHICSHLFFDSFPSFIQFLGYMSFTLKVKYERFSPSSRMGCFFNILKVYAFDGPSWIFICGLDFPADAIYS